MNGLILPTPFAYPSKPHERKHGPKGYKPYRKFKNWIRDEFEFRCVYCLERELWHPNRQASFSIDHIEGQTAHPDRICDYDNFAYACLRCNSAKRDVATIDPTKEALGNHLRIDEAGRIHALSPEGRVLILLLHLDEGPALETREDILEIIELKQKYPEDRVVNSLFDRRFRYPKVLPDLVKYRPPAGNSRPKGILTCHFRRRKVGMLPRHY